VYTSLFVPVGAAAEAAVRRTDVNTRVGLFVLPDFRAVGSAIRITSRHDAELYVLLKKVRTVGP